MAAKEKHIPTRMCCICRKRAPKEILARFIQGTGEAFPMPDQRQTAPGRGIYVCRDERCHEAFSRRNAKRKVKGQDV